MQADIGSIGQEFGQRQLEQWESDHQARLGATPSGQPMSFWRYS